MNFFEFSTRRQSTKFNFFRSRRFFPDYCFIEQNKIQFLFGENCHNKFFVKRLKCPFISIQLCRMIEATRNCARQQRADLNARNDTIIIKYCCSMLGASAAAKWIVNEDKVQWRHKRVGCTTEMMMRSPRRLENVFCWNEMPQHAFESALNLSYSISLNTRSALNSIFINILVVLCE